MESVCEAERFKPFDVNTIKVVSFDLNDLRVGEDVSKLD